MVHLLKKVRELYLILSYQILHTLPTTPQLPHIQSLPFIENFLILKPHLQLLQ